MTFSGRSRSYFEGALLWLLPVIFLFWLYSEGLRTWFVGDDFAWLGLLREVHNFHDVVRVLFSTAAQGTIRPWSERGFFLLFEKLFGLDNFPFRICVFTTMTANVALVVWITRRITGSAIAAFSAPVLWTANTALTTVMTWSSAYNEALCTFFLLTAMACFIRYAETGRRSFWWWQVVVFTLGFGALEINVIYPALAAAYVLFVIAPEKAAPETPKRLLLSLAPLFLISAVYYLVHRALAPLPKDGPYAVAIDRRIFDTLAVYWHWSLVPQTWADAGKSVIAGAAVFWTVTLALAGFLCRQIAKRRYIVLFFVFWFLITLAPMIPLPDHHTDYYLTIPLIGLAMLAGFAISRAAQASWVWQGMGWRAVALVAVAAYLSAMIPITRMASRWWLDRSIAVRGVVLGVETANHTHPGKTIVLDGLTSDVYNDTLAHSAFSRVGIRSAVYLTPSARLNIHPAFDPGRLLPFIIDEAALQNAITHDEVVIYSDVGDHLRNVTGVWERANFHKTSDPLPRRVDVSNPLLAYLLGPEWFSVESPGFRWMPRRATLRLGGPRSANDKLLLQGYCPPEQLKAGFVDIAVSVDGIPLRSTRIGEPESSFTRLFVVPRALVGRESVDVAISVDRVRQEPGGRELGLVFGTIAFEP